MAWGVKGWPKLGWGVATMRSMIAAMAAAAAAAASPALAADDWGPKIAAMGGDGGFPGSVSLSVDITARVEATCGFAQAPSGEYDLGDLTLAFEKVAPLQVECSSPFRVGVVAARGALSADGVGPVPGYANQIPYEVMLNIATNAGAPVSAQCAASGLTAAGACGFKGPASGSQGLSVAQPSVGQNGSFIRVRSPGGAPYAGPSVPLAANNYTDTLTVTISPAS